MAQLPTITKGRPAAHGASFLSRPPLLTPPGASVAATTSGVLNGGVLDHPASGALLPAAAGTGVFVGAGAVPDPNNERDRGRGQGHNGRRGYGRCGRRGQGASRPTDSPLSSQAYLMQQATKKRLTSVTTKGVLQDPLPENAEVTKINGLSVTSQSHEGAPSDSTQSGL